MLIFSRWTHDRASRAPKRSNVGPCVCIKGPKAGQWPWRKPITIVERLARSFFGCPVEAESRGGHSLALWGNNDWSSTGIRGYRISLRPSGSPRLPSLTSTLVPAMINTRLPYSIRRIWAARIERFGNGRAPIIATIKASAYAPWAEAFLTSRPWFVRFIIRKLTPPRAGLDVLRYLEMEIDIENCFFQCPNIG